MDDEEFPFAHIQDVLGQSTFIKTYTVIALGYPCTAEPQSVMEELYRAADRLTRAFPYLAGHVVRRGAGPGKTGLATVMPYPPSARTSLVIFKDCTQLCQPFETIMKRGAPMEMLDGHLLSVHRPLPDLYDESEKPAPVVEIQANFVHGGVILAFQGNHTIMDMNGLGQVIRLYAKALRTEIFSDDEVEQGNLDRRDIVKLLGPDDEKVDMSKYLVREKEVQQPPSQPQTPAVVAQWVDLHFPADKLVELKELASRPPPGDQCNDKTAQWVSTDDALTAFLCARITAARLKRMHRMAPKAIFCRAVNGRRFLGIPAGYMGHLVWCVSSEVLMESVATITDNFGSLARQMRADLDAIRPVEIQSFATALAASEDKGALSQGAGMDTADGFDLMLSSWSGLGFSDIVFGRLGRSVFTRRPKFAPIEGLLYLMPKSVEGNVDVACCLRSEDVYRLRSDEEFAKYVTCLG